MIVLIELLSILYKNRYHYDKKNMGIEPNNAPSQPRHLTAYCLSDKVFVACWNINDHTICMQFATL